MEEVFQKDTHDLRLLLRVLTTYKEGLGLRHADVSTMVHFVDVKPFPEGLDFNPQLVFANDFGDEGGL